jgi:hypothetical protein
VLVSLPVVDSDSCCVAESVAETLWDLLAVSDGVSVRDLVRE